MAGTLFENNESPSLLFEEQGSDPATPAAGFWRAFFKAGGIYIIDDAGVVTGPLAPASGVPSGSSNPAQPAYGNDVPFYRTDLKRMVFYNGTRWLVAGEPLRVRVSPFTDAAARIISASVNGYEKAGVPYLDGCSDILVESVTVAYYISSGGTALSASHKWTFATKASRNATNNTLDTIATNVIDSGASAQNLRITATVNALLDNGTAHSWFQVDVGKTGTPGNIQAFTEIICRGVVA